jgi:hypothetical protein
MRALDQQKVESDQVATVELMGSSFIFEET